MSSGKQIDAILLDFSKAFDKVPHRRLLMKLDHYGIRGCDIFGQVIGEYEEQQWSEYRALGHPRVYITGGRVCAV
jgi:hypothetical protein